MSSIRVVHFDDTGEEAITFYIGRVEQAPPGALGDMPRRHSFYLVVWITNGVGWHFIDFEGYAIQPNTLYFVAPGQIQYWDIEAPPMGYYLIFEDELFHLNGAGQFLSKLGLFTIYDNAPALYLRGDAADRITQIVLDIEAEYYSDQFGREESIFSLLQLLLIRAQRQAKPANLQQSPGASEQLAYRFLQLVEEQATREHNLSAYAGQLGVTVGHLTETVKDVRGLPAGVVLRQRLVLEAKRLLVHSELTIAQIAEQLNFYDPSYFWPFLQKGNRPDAPHLPRRFPKKVPE